MKTVLIVEDQIDFLAIQSLYLQHHGYRVLTANTGHAGVQTAREHKPDLILMDFLVPDMDGIRATQELKNDPRTENIPVILLTSLSYGAVGRRAKAAGCDGYLAKPCEPIRILEEVQRRIG